MRKIIRSSHLLALVLTLVVLRLQTGWDIRQPHLTTLHQTSRTQPGPDTQFTPYVVVDLGTLGGKTSSATRINDHEQVVGYSETALFKLGHRVGHAFLWQKGRMRDIGGFARLDSSYATNINNKGEIVGYVLPPGSNNDVNHAFVWIQGKVRYLRPLPGCWYSQATGVNDAGVVVGYCIRGDRRGPSMDQHNEEMTYACRWVKGRTLPLGALGGAYSYANGINNAGQIVGKADAADFSTTHPFLWDHGRMRDLAVTNAAATALRGEATGISGNGNVVGYFVMRSGSDGFLWRAGRLQDLQPLIDQNGTPVDVNTWQEGISTDVNNQGDVVGYSNPSPQIALAAVIWRNGVARNLNALIPADSSWVLENALSINAQGEIVGNGKHNGVEHAFLLKPNLNYKA